MTISVASDGHRPRILGLLNDAALLLLVVLAFPLVILLLGAPVALLVRLLAAIARALGWPLD